MAALRVVFIVFGCLVTFPTSAVADGWGIGQLDHYASESFQLGPNVTAAVEVGTGNLNVTVKGFGIEAMGPDLEADFTYNSIATDVDLAGTSGQNWSGMGPGWTHGGNWRMGADGADGRALTLSNGAGVYFKKVNGAFQTPPGINGKLRRKTVSGIWFDELERYDVRSFMRFNANGQLDSWMDQNGNGLTYAYYPGLMFSDGRSRLSSITDTSGRKLTYTYVGKQLSAVTDSAGRKYQLSYDGSGRLIAIFDPLGAKTGFEYGGSSTGLAAVVLPSGKRTTFGYDPNAWTKSVLTVTQPGASSGGDVTRIQTGLSSALGWGYQETLITRPRGTQLRYTVYGGVMLDLDFRVVKKSDAAHTVTLIHDAHFNLTAESDSSGTAQSAYDANNQQTLAKEPTGAETRWRYENTAFPSLPTSYIEPYGDKHTFSYDSRGNRTLITYADGKTRSFKYSANGALVSVVSSTSGEVAAYEYDSYGNRTKSTSPSQGSIQFEYDALGRVTKQIRASGKWVSFEYDALDRVTRVSSSDGESQVSSFDADGNLIRTADQQGETTFTFDGVNRPIRTDAPVGSTVREYDANGNLKALSDLGGRTTYEYDAADRAVGIVDPAGRKIVYKRNADGDVVETALPTVRASKITRSFDASHRVKKLAANATPHPDDRLARKVCNSDAPAGSDPTQDTPVDCISSEYSYFDNVAGTTKDVARLTTEIDSVEKRSYNYVYDSRHRLARVAQLRLPDLATVNDWTYSYDGDGNRTEAKLNSESLKSNFDGSGRLVSLGEGNSAKSVTIDPDGNVTVMPSGVTGVTGATYEYNAFGQLKNRTTEAGLTPFAYGGAGNKPIAKWGDTALQIDELLLRASNDSGGPVSYVSDPEGALVAMVRGTKSWYFVTDSRRSLVGLINQDGHFVGRRQFDPFGKERVRAFAGSDTPLPRVGFAGGLTDDSSHLVKFGHRFYDPAIGRWTQPDPLDQASDPFDFNPFVYAGNDPLNNSDPSGLFLKKAWKIFMKRSPYIWAFRCGWRAGGYHKDGRGRWVTRSVKFCAWEWVLS